MSDLEKLKRLGEAFRGIREAYEKSISQPPATKQKRPRSRPASRRK